MLEHPGPLSEWFDPLDKGGTSETMTSEQLEDSLQDDSNLTLLLRQLVVAVEKGIERIPVDELVVSWACPHPLNVTDVSHRWGWWQQTNASIESSPPSLSETESCPGCALSLPCQTPVEKKDSCSQTSPLEVMAGIIPHIDSSDSSGAEDEPDDVKKKKINQGNKENGRSSSLTSDSQHQHKIPVPGSILELSEEVLFAGITLPGLRDGDGRPVIVINGDESKDKLLQVEPSDVARLFLYYQEIPRKEDLKNGLCLVIHGKSGEYLSILDRSLSIIQDSFLVTRIVYWSNEDDQDKKSQKYFNIKGVQLETLRSRQEFELLLPENDSNNHDQQHWVTFRKSVDLLTRECRCAARTLVSSLASLRTSACTCPTSPFHARQQLEQQKQLVSRALDDVTVRRLQRDGDDLISSLETRLKKVGGSPDERLSVSRCRTLLREVQRSSQKLTHLAEKRYQRLREYLRRRAAQEDAVQVLSWICEHGEAALTSNSALADNLVDIKQQELEFEKFYFIAMRHIERGNDLLEDSNLGAVGNSSGPESMPVQLETTTSIYPMATSTPNNTQSGGKGGMRDLARSLRHHLKSFGERLDDTREKVEDASRCYYLLDKAYEWALDAMKYISGMKLDHCCGVGHVEYLLDHLQQYLEAHPPVSMETFEEMGQLANKLHNQKLFEQTKVAQDRCEETRNLIESRQDALVQLRKQLKENKEDISKESFKLPLPECFRFGSEEWPSMTSPSCDDSVEDTNNHNNRRHSCHSLLTPPCVCNRTSTTEQKDSNNRSVSNKSNASRSSSSFSSTCSSDSSIDSSLLNKFTNGSKAKRPPSLDKLQRRGCVWQFNGANGDKLNNSVLSETIDENESQSSGTPESCRDSSERSSNPSTKALSPLPVNNHLQYLGNLPLGEIDESTLSEEQLKAKKTLLLIMREMIQTEQVYVQSLEYVIDNYIPELTRDDIPQALRGHRNAVFGNIEKIHEFHGHYFLKELEACEADPFSVGQCFLRHESQFYLYALYNKNKPKCDGLMSEYGNAFFKTKQLQLNDKMDLASYLLKPVQRMGKYALLLKQLLKECPEKRPEYADLKAAEEMVKFQLRHGNDLLAMDSLRDCDVNVKEQGRLLRQSEFLVWQGKGKKCLRHVFVFEDLILFSKSRRDPERKNLDVYIYKNSIKTTDIGMTAQLIESNTKFEIWFRKRKVHDTYTLQAMSPEIKDAWTKELSQLLWKQALKNREIRYIEMSSMGIGNKPCLDIKPSEDQISDRSISIAQLVKAPRFRNSIAMPSGTELVRSNKRPHSIISVSSSSSSGSSQASFPISSSGTGTLNLGFEPTDSPKTSHRSITLHSQCSTESGIIADLSLTLEDLDTSHNSRHHKQVVRSDSSATSNSVDSIPTSPDMPLYSGIESPQKTPNSYGVKGTEERRQSDTGIEEIEEEETITPV